MSPKVSPPESVTPDSHGKAPAEKWQAAGSGAHYTSGRWSSKRREHRDPRAIGRLLTEAGIASGTILDAACGTGRLRTTLEAGTRRWVGLDASASMLAEAQKQPNDTLLRGRVEHLPFRDGAFDAVVANRLLHHFHQPEDLRIVLGELLRVSSGPVIASYWNAASLPAWKRRVGLAKSEGPSGRVAHPTSRLRKIAASLNAELVSTRHVLPLFSQQSFAVFRKRER